MRFRNFAKKRMKRLLSLVLVTFVMEVAHAQYDNAIVTVSTAGRETPHESTIKGYLLILSTKGDTPIVHSASTEPSRPYTTPATFHTCQSRQWMHPYKACKSDIRLVMLSPTHTSAPGQDTKRAESDYEATKQSKEL